MTWDKNTTLDALLHSPWKSVRHPDNARDRAWYDGITRLSSAVAAAVDAFPQRFTLELGFSVGKRIAEQEKDFTPEEFRERLKELGIAPQETTVSEVQPMAELWTALRRLARYEGSSYRHTTELLGLRGKLFSLAAANPRLWAEALPWILVRDSEFGKTAQTLTLELASGEPVVRASLIKACADEHEPIRLLARGLRALLEGLDNPAPAFARTLADAAAHYMDGSPVFPHPLGPLSATWLGSVGVERTLGDGARRACDRFGAEVRAQGGDIEEALTKALLKELEVEFREIKPRLKILGQGKGRSLVPALSLSQRPASKRSEEPIYGCDLAWVLNAMVPGRLRATWADLVQVKKSSALYHFRDGRPRADSWRIETNQLAGILTWSATAAYWLIASEGEVLVVPARHLEGIRCGTGKTSTAKTFTIGYHEVRSVAIPLEQYLVDLLIGQWIGTSFEKTVQFARGENTNIRPRIVVEITVRVGNQEGN